MVYHGAWLGSFCRAHREALRALNDLQTELLRDSWALLRRDPYVVEAAKKRIALDSSFNDEQTKALLEKIRSNIVPRDWVNNLYYGTMMWALGDKETGMEYVRDNLESYKTETKISGAVLQAMQEGSFLNDSFYLNIKPEDLTDRLSQDVQSLLTDWFSGNFESALHTAEDMIAGKRSGIANNRNIIATPSRPENSSGRFFYRANFARPIISYHIISYFFAGDLTTEAL